MAILILLLFLPTRIVGPYPFSTSQPPFLSFPPVVLRCLASPDRSFPPSSLLGSPLTRRILIFFILFSLCPLLLLLLLSVSVPVLLLSCPSFRCLFVLSLSLCLSLFLPSLYPRPHAPLSCLLACSARHSPLSTPSVHTSLDPSAYLCSPLVCPSPTRPLGGCSPNTRSHFRFPCPRRFHSPPRVPFSPALLWHPMPLLSPIDSSLWCDRLGVRSSRLNHPLLFTTHSPPHCADTPLFNAQHARTPFPARAWPSLLSAP